MAFLRLFLQFSAVICLFCGLSVQGESIFSFRTGSIVSPKNVQDPKYLITYVAPSDNLDSITLEPGQETVNMTNGKGEKFMCILPPPLEEDGGEGEDSLNNSHGSSRTSNDEDVTRQSPEDLLDSLNKLPCFYLIESWWTYELCYKRHLRQFHVEHEQVVQEFYLGYYDEAATEQLQSEKGSAPFVQKDPRSATATQRYHAHMYTKGTLCDLTEHHRQAEVRYVCSEEKITGISSYEERPSCNYVVTFVTPDLCRHPQFKKETRPVNVIYCHTLPPNSGERERREEEEGEGEEIRAPDSALSLQVGEEEGEGEGAGEGEGEREGEGEEDDVETLEARFNEL